MTATIGSGAVHFTWDRRHEPIAEVAPPTTLVVSTRDGFNGQIGSPAMAPLLDADLRRSLRLETPLTGPIAITGARPGQTLRVDLVELVPHGVGSCVVWPRWARWDFLPESMRADLPDAAVRTFDLDAVGPGGVVDIDGGIELPLRPVLGMIGAAPAEGEFLSFAGAPRAFGGTFDCTDVRAGHSVFLPVSVPHALLSVGDGHAVQGDGEVCGTAVECAMRATLRVSLKDLPLAGPLIMTPTELLVVGFARTLDDAVRRVVSRATDMLAEREQLAKADAYMLCSVVGDVRVNQVVALPHVSVRLALPLEHLAGTRAVLGDPMPEVA